MVTLVLVRRILFASCVSGRMRELLWNLLCASVKKKTYEMEKAKEKENGKKEKQMEKEGDSCRIREDVIADMDYICVWRIKYWSLQLRDFTTTLPMFIADSEEICPRFR